MLQWLQAGKGITITEKVTEDSEPVKGVEIIMETSKELDTRLPFIVNVQENQIPMYEDDDIKVNVVSADFLKTNTNFGNPIQGAFYLDIQLKKQDSK